MQYIDNNTYNKMPKNIPKPSHFKITSLTQSLHFKGAQYKDLIHERLLNMGKLGNLEPVDNNIYCFKTPLSIEIKALDNLMNIEEYSFDRIKMTK